MENFFAPFLKTHTNPSSTTIGSRSSSSSSSNTGLEQHGIVYPQSSNTNFPHNTNGQIGFSDQPCFIQNDLNTQFQNVPSFSKVDQAPLCPFPTEAYGMVSSEPGSGEEEHKKRMVALKSKENRDKRKHVIRQRSKSSTPMASLEGITRQQLVPSGGSPVRIPIRQNNAVNFLLTPDGKRLEEILTKELEKSDASRLGRIVLPKREAEDKLPTLRNKEGIDIWLKDLYCGILWSMKYKYWLNNRSRMYLLGNTWDFMNHHKLQKGDFITLYKDEWENLYVSARKNERNLEESEPSSDMGMLNEADAYLAHLTKELSHNKKEEDATNNLLNQCNGSGSCSRGTEEDNIVKHQLMLNNAGEEASNQETQLRDPFMSMNSVNEGPSNQASNEAEAAIPLNAGKRIKAVDDDDVFGDLDNIFEIGHNNHGYKFW